MAAKSGSGKKTDSTSSGDAGDKDRLIAELKGRVAVLENELRLKQSDAISRECADRKLMEDFLVLFQNMVDKAADMVFLLGPVSRIRYANKAACKALGYTREELQSMTVFDINQIHNQDNWQGHEEELKRRGSMTFENVLKTKDGRLIPVEISANYARLGDREYNYSFIRDITEHKQVEEILRRSRDELEIKVRERMAELSEREAVLRQIIETSPVPMVVYREEKNYHINKKFIDTFGYTKEDIPSVAEWWPLAYPDEAYREFVKNRWYAAVGEAVRDKASIAPQEVIVACKDGSRKYVFAYFSSIGDMNLAILQDITDRKHAEKELNAEKRQAELYLDLMGHDINNLHQIALGYLELAKEMPPGEEQSMFLDKPVEVLQRSAQLIQNVRKLQKLREGVFQNRDIDVGVVLKEVQREFGAVPDKRVMLRVKGRCRVKANELLHDVFANLVSNSIKHTGEKTNITISLINIKGDGGRYCRVAVEDDGPGIPDDFKGVVFNRALRSTDKAKGIGLGLYLVKSLVESYGGSVSVEDRVPGDHTKGARFVVMLPAVE